MTNSKAEEDAGNEQEIGVTETRDTTSAATLEIGLSCSHREEDEWNAAE